MPFDRGSITFTIFELPEALPENVIDLFAAHKAGTLDSVSEEPQIGWVTGHHLLDTAIDSASAQTGGCYYLALRQAVRKIPGSLLNALCRREEQAYMKANNLEYVSGKLKRQIKEETVEKHTPVRQQTCNARRDLQYCGAKRARRWRLRHSPGRQHS